MVFEQITGGAGDEPGPAGLSGVQVLGGRASAIAQSFSSCNTSNRTASLEESHSDHRPARRAADVIVWSIVRRTKHGRSGLDYIGAEGRIVAAPQAAAVGRVKVKQEPPVGLSVAGMVPPWRSRMRLQIASPSPVPR